MNSVGSAPGLGDLSQGTLCTHPCEHNFLQECVEELRKLGVLQACPLCRAAFPAGPEKLFEDATRLYVHVTRKVESGKPSWHTLTASEQKSVTKAKAMLTTAAKQGHALAQAVLSTMYFSDEEVSQDHNEAARWSRKAADQGHAKSQYHLGAMYARGEGVPQDFEEAVQWAQKAADQGHVGAQRLLAIISSH
jgi:TPR repeat protein